MRNCENWPISKGLRLVNTRTLKILIDTNIWLDYYTGREEASGYSSKLMKELLCSKHDVLASSLSTKDVYYLLQVYLKLAHRKQYKNAPVLEQVLAIQEAAWKSVQHMIEVSKVAAIDSAECKRALELRKTCNDYEDNLIVACAESFDADYLVTNDKSLRAPDTITVVSSSQLYARLF